MSFSYGLVSVTILALSSWNFEWYFSLIGVFTAFYNFPSYKCDSNSRSTMPCCVAEFLFLSRAVTAFIFFREVAPQCLEEGGAWVRGPAPVRHMERPPTQPIL